MAPAGPAPEPTGSDRHQARERALSLLYEAAMKGLRPSQVLAALPVPPDPFCEALVTGVEGRQVRAEELVAAAAKEGWPLDRLAVIDRLVLVLAVSELLDPDGPPTAVVINEAVDLASTYSTEDSGRFVNGVLSTVAAQVR